MDVGDEAIQQKQEENPKPKPNRRGQERPCTQVRRALQRRNQQAPYACRNHHARREAAQALLHLLWQVAFEEENQRSAQRCAEKGHEQPLQNLCVHQK